MIDTRTVLAGPVADQAALHELLVRTHGSPNRRNAGRASAGLGFAGTKRFASTAVHGCVPMGLIWYHRHVMLAKRAQMCWP